MSMSNGPFSQVAGKPAINPELPFNLTLLQDDPTLSDFPIGLGAIRHLEGGTATCGIMTGRVTFPIHDVAGTLVAYAGVMPDDPTDWLFPRNFRPELELFNVHRVLKGSVDDFGAGLIVVEGIMEVLSVVDAGFFSVVGLLGKPSASQIDLLELASAWFSRKVTLLLPEGALREELRKALSPWTFTRTCYASSSKLFELSVPERAQLLV